MRVLAVLPCRLGSSRLPNKPLMEFGGRPLVQHVYASVLQAHSVERIIVATDSPRVAEVAAGFGAECFMSSEEHLCGSDRVAEVAAKYPEYPVVLNIQVDALAIRREMIDALAAPFLRGEDVAVTALRSVITDEAELTNPNVVKVVVDKNGFALYYSRLPIPYSGKGKRVVYYKNMGMYGFQREMLINCYSNRRTALEEAESLEQLRVLENGGRILTVLTNYRILEINSREEAIKAGEKIDEYNTENR